MNDDDFLRFIATEIRDSLISEPRKFDRKIFLGGAAPGAPSQVRNRIARGLVQRRHRRWFDEYDIYYPETLFDGLMAGPDRYDLLTLENMLAEGVDAVVLVNESPGAYAELGAFANHELLRQKLVVIQESKYKTTKSFIRHGPIRLLEDLGVGKVLYIDFAYVEKHIDEIHKAIGDVARKDPVAFQFGNILHSHHFVLPCLFVMECVSRREVVTLVAHVASLSLRKAEVVASSAISILLRDSLAFADGDGLRLTELGVSEFYKKSRWERSRARYSRSAIDQLRVAVLSRQRRHLRQWA